MSAIDAALSALVRDAVKAALADALAHQRADDLAGDTLDQRGAAAHLSVSVETLMAMWRDGRVPGLQVSEHRWRFSRRGLTQALSGEWQAAGPQAA